MPLSQTETLLATGVRFRTESAFISAVEAAARSLRVCQFDHRTCENGGPNGANANVRLSPKRSFIRRRPNVRYAPMADILATTQIIVGG
jgi:hypothetical protein